MIAQDVMELEKAVKRVSVREKVIRWLNGVK